MEHWAGRVAKAALGGQAPSLGGPQPDVAMHHGRASGGGDNGAGDTTEAGAVGGPAAATPTRVAPAQAGGKMARAYSRSRSPDSRVSKLADKLRTWSKKGSEQLSPEQLQAAQRELWGTATKLAQEEEENL